MIYVNGDSHSAGAEIINNYCCAQDDPRFLAYGRRAHPEAVVQTYGYRMSKALNQGFFCEAESGSSNARILRTTREFLKNSDNKEKAHVVIGWSTWEREEWKHGEEYIQITASGTDSVPASMQKEYKEWVDKQTKNEYYRKTQLWHDKIYDFHLELRSQNIKHTFFNTFNYFDIDKQLQEDWHDQFVNPYIQDYTYFYYLKNKGISPVGEHGHHYGLNGHRAWTKIVLENYLAQYQQNKSPNYNRTKFPLIDVKPMVDKKRNF